MKRFYSFCLTAIFVAAATATAFAQSTVVIDLTGTLTGGGDGWTYEARTSKSDALIRIDNTATEPVNYLIKGTSSGSLAIRVVTGEKNANTKLNITLENAQFAELYLKQSSAVAVTLVGNNTLTGSSNNAINVEGSGAKLSIDGVGKLTTTNSSKLVSTGSVTIKGGIVDVADAITKGANVEINGEKVLLKAASVTGTVTKTKGIIFIGNTGEVCGTGSVTLPEALTITSGQTLTVSSTATLNVPSGMNFEINGGSVVNNGAIVGKIASKITVTAADIVIIGNTDPGKVYYGDVVTIDFSKLKVDGLSGDGAKTDINPADFTYRWINIKGTETKGATYTVIGDDVGVNIRVGIKSTLYQISETFSQTNAITVQKRPLSIKSTSLVPSGQLLLVEKEYDGSATIDKDTTFISDDIVTGDELKINITGTAGTNATGNANVGTNKNIFGIALALKGDAASYYALQPYAKQGQIRVNITPKPVSITNADIAVSKVYDGTTGVQLSNISLVNNGTLNSRNGIVTSDVNRGVRVKVSDLLDAEYDGADASTAREVTISRGLELVGSSGTANTYSKNYIIETDGGTVTIDNAEITPAPLIITPPDNATRVYGSDPETLDPVYGEFVPGENKDVLKKTYTVGFSGTAPVQSSDAGEYPIIIEATGTDSEVNYDVTYSGTDKLTITKAPLKIIAIDTARYYSEEPGKEPIATKFRVKYDKLFLWDASLTLVDASTLSADTKADSPAGTYKITLPSPGGITADNYDVTFVPGELTVKPALHSIDIESAWPDADGKWMTEISGAVRLPFRTSAGVEVDYTFTPSDAATIVDHLLIPLKGGDIKLTTSTSSNNPNYANLVEDHVIHVSTPPQRPTLREVYIPQVPGVVTDWPAGLHYVESGKEYTFKLSPEAGREFTDAPVVNVQPALANVSVTRNADGKSYTVRIPGVVRNIEINIEAPVTPSVANALITADRIWGAGGRLYIQAATPGEAQVYSLSGALVKTVRYAGGETVETLPAGIYIIRTHGKAQKVAVTK